MLFKIIPQIEKIFLKFELEFTVNRTFSKNIDLIVKFKIFLFSQS